MRTLLLRTSVTDETLPYSPRIIKTNHLQDSAKRTSVLTGAQLSIW